MRRYWQIHVVQICQAGGVRALLMNFRHASLDTTCPTDTGDAV